MGETSLVLAAWGGQSSIEEGEGSHHLPKEGRIGLEGRDLCLSHLLLFLLQVWARAVYCYVLQTTLSQVSVPLGCCWAFRF